MSELFRNKSRNSKADQLYASHPASTELLTNITNVCSMIQNKEKWGPNEWLVTAEHFERLGKSPYMHIMQILGCVPRIRICETEVVEKVWYAKGRIVGNILIWCLRFGNKGGDGQVYN
ncbi:hypothetical protein M9H77_30269 [Catharanthus roseus]|uniref:Uncharacterized protein n=1 Tax=Catharanthus roseus TaxID=4058 RepID=A0ACB9ZWT2_CATRO|nr:hypothetical protein M9H77_30269 [Catharanthus roseus]